MKIPQCFSENQGNHRENVRKKHFLKYEAPDDDLYNFVTFFIIQEIILRRNRCCIRVHSGS